MKVTEKTQKQAQKEKIKKKPIDKSKKEQVLIVAQEFKFARLLSGNEKKSRDKVLKTLKRWLQNCFTKGHEFKEDDFIRVWKGLFYAVWMSDKPLVQEELCENIAEILDLFPPEHLKHALMMTKAGLKVLATEWYGIDQHRMDKFLMLVRRYLRGSLRCLLRSSWSVHSCQMYAKMLTASDGILCVKTPQYAKNATSMILHVIDCYLEEIAKVSKGEIPEESLAALLHPFTSLVCGGEALVLCVAARRALTTLLRQSEMGLQYEEATRAWQKMGCPTGGPEALELMSDDDGDNDMADDDSHREPPSALDPRAGRVNVYLPLLPVPAALLAHQLRTLMSKASSKAYKRASICLKRFEALTNNEYPLVVKDTDRPESPEPQPEPEQLAESLTSLEKSLVAQSDELALRGLKRKHRKRLLAKSRAGLSIIEDVATLTDAQADSTNGGWQVEATEPEEEKSDKNSSNKENEVVKKKNIKRKSKENAENKAKKTKAEVNTKKEVKLNGKETDGFKYKRVKLTAKRIAEHTMTLEEYLAKTKSEKEANSEKEDNTGISENRNKKKKAEANSEVKMNGHEKKGKTNNNKAQKVVKNAPKLIGEDSQKKGKNAKSNVLVNKENSKATESKDENDASTEVKKAPRQKVLPMSKIKNYQKQVSLRSGPKEIQKKGNKNSPKKVNLETPKKVKFVLKNNGMQAPVDYYKSVKQSPNIPFDSSKRPSKTNLKPSTPSPINPFFKKKLRLRS